MSSPAGDFLLDNLTADLAEFESFLATATRDAVKEVLRVKIAEVRVKVAQRQEQLRVIAAAKEAAAAAALSPPAGLPTPSGPIYEPINSFSWGDEDGNVNVYIMSGVDGVGALPKEQISCKFGLREFDLTINGLNGRNYRLVKTKLSGDIDPSASTFRAKGNRVTIVLKKKEKYPTWYKLEEDRPSTTTTGEKKKADAESPESSIMDMMKKMYDEGDDNMKRTIAEAWTKAQQQRGGGAGMPDI